MVKLKTLAPNQVVVTEEEGTTLFSYDTPICTKLLNGDIILYPEWRCSVTTSKYRAKFLYESTKETQAQLDKGVYTLGYYYA